MKILHICLCGPYTDDFNYQENLLSLQHKEMGYDVSIIASCEYYKNGILKNKDEGVYINQKNIKVYRLCSNKVICQKITTKIRKYNKFDLYLNKVNPDIIFCHGFQFYNILDVVKFKKNHTKTKVFIDCHSDKSNSAQNLISREILHKIYYKYLLKKSLETTKYILSVAESVSEFLTDIYHLNKKYIKEFPLGGIQYDVDESEKKAIRHKIGIDTNDILMLHSGKFDEKKKSYELIKTIKQYNYNNSNSKIKLIICGSFENDYYEKISPLFDEKIKYIGWVNGDELLQLLAVSDIYAQIGSQSATLQNAACCGCALLVYPHSTYTRIFKNNIDFVKNGEEIYSFLKKIEDPKYLNHLKYITKKIAREQLDYHNLAKIIYEE